jgi:hypothetical protein
LPDQWKESILIPVHKKCDKTDCSNHREISLPSTSYKMLSSIFLSMLSSYIDKITRDRQCEFRRNRSTTIQIILYCSILLHSSLNFDQSEVLVQIFFWIFTYYFFILSRVSFSATVNNCGLRIWSLYLFGIFTKQNYS